jgi:hypothetical protein
MISFSLIAKLIIFSDKFRKKIREDLVNMDYPICYYGCENPTNLRSINCCCSRTIMACDGCYDAHDANNKTIAKCICGDNECLEVLNHHEKCPECHSGYLLYINKNIKTCNSNSGCDFSKCNCGVNFSFNEWFKQDSDKLSHEGCDIVVLNNDIKYQGSMICDNTDSKIPCECKKCVVFCLRCDEVKPRVKSKPSVLVTNCICGNYCTSCVNEVKICCICSNGKIDDNFEGDCMICGEEKVEVNQSFNFYFDCKCKEPIVCVNCYQRLPKCSICKNISVKEKAIFNSDTKVRCCVGFIVVGHDQGYHYCIHRNCQCYDLVNESADATRQLVNDIYWN